ncbi:MAG: DUF6076 domain-containing protein [Oscillospiraceae bacterium]|nr:DUF6076 domain-containing protein [Oscillospiraceae bacterium]
MAYKSLPTSEKEDKVQEFTAHFYDDVVKTGDEILPIGQVSTEILNLPEQLFYDLRDKSMALLNGVNSLFNSNIQKDSAIIASVQKDLNAVWEVLFELPPFRYLRLDRETPRNLLLLASTKHREEFEKSITPGTRENEILRDFFEKIISASDEISVFYNYVSTMLDLCFEDLKKRNAEHYAVGVYKFFSDESTINEIMKMFPPLPRFVFQQSRAVSIEYIPMPSPTNNKVYCLAERMEFTSLGDFLHIDFFRGLTKGNVPRRCHNCGRFFLLTAGYDTCYCNNIAPGETEKTCRKVGAHRKEAEKAKNRTPVQAEYAKVYSRLKTRKCRGKISGDEWNAAVAKAMEIRDLAERGEIGDVEMRRLFWEI